VQALREMRRVTKPNGLVAARDSDYAGFIWYPLMPELDDWLSLYRTVARANGGEPDAGRRLLSWAREAGFTDITATSSTWCFAPPADREFWGAMWSERVLTPAFATHARKAGATRSDLERISQAWQTWITAEDGWFSIVHGEILCRV